MQAKHIAILITSGLLILAAVLGLNKTLTGFLTLPTGNVIAERAVEIPLPNITENITNETNITETNVTNETNETTTQISGGVAPIELPPQAQGPPDFLSNPSFEDKRANNQNIPVNWFWNNNWDNVENDSATWDTNLVYLDHSTTHSSGVSLAHNKNSFGNGFAIRSRNIKVNEGKTYHVEFYVQTNATGTNAIPETSWILFDKNGNILEPTKSGQQGIIFNSNNAWESNNCQFCGGGNTKVDMVDSGDWKKIAFEFTVPVGENADHVSFVIDMLGEGASWSYWYLDDFTFSAV